MAFYYGLPLCAKINWEEEDEKMTLGSVVFPSPPTFKV